MSTRKPCPACGNYHQELTPLGMILHAGRYNMMQNPTGNPKSMRSYKAVADSNKDSHRGYDELVKAALGPSRDQSVFKSSLLNEWNTSLDMKSLIIGIAATMGVVQMFPRFFNLQRR